MSKGLRGAEELTGTVGFHKQAKRHQTYVIAASFTDKRMPDKHIVSLGFNSLLFYSRTYMENQKIIVIY